MPEFVRYPVRDRASWEFYRERATPRRFLSREEMEARCRRYDARDRPLCVGAGSTYGRLRGLLGPEAVSLAFYDAPDLLHDILDWSLERTRREVFPLVERLRPCCSRRATSRSTARRTTARCATARAPAASRSSPWTPTATPWSSSAWPRRAG